MLKKNKKLIIVTTLITLLPILMGLVLWNQLPDRVPTHFDINGQPDNWGSKAFAVFGLPAFLAAVHLICTLATAADPRKQNISDKMYALVLWVCPITSVLMNSAIFLISLGKDINMSTICMIMVGAMFIIVGNYMPKCRQNYTIGIKLPWTLSDEDNWNKTHRMAGWLWMAVGVVFLVLAFLGKITLWLFFAAIFITVIIPTIYSFLYHLKKEKEQ
ncbi:MAG: SdpI family protein [Oscillospiraceae bacterium]|nr:SdpI family protein [Oscillospiraceae bacterium]